MSDNQMFWDYWNSIDPKIREKAVDILRNTVAPETLEEIRKGVEEHGSLEWPDKEPFTTYDTVVFQDGEEMALPNSFHHSYGMTIRNLLRYNGLTDMESLPAFDAYYGKGSGIHNWDDAYVQALEVAAHA